LRWSWCTLCSSLVLSGVNVPHDREEFGPFDLTTIVGIFLLEDLLDGLFIASLSHCLEDQGEFPGIDGIASVQVESSEDLSKGQDVALGEFVEGLSWFQEFFNKVVGLEWVELSHDLEEFDPLDLSTSVNVDFIDDRLQLSSGDSKTHVPEGCVEFVYVDGIAPVEVELSECLIEDVDILSGEFREFRKGWFEVFSFPLRSLRWVQVSHQTKKFGPLEVTTLIGIEDLDESVDFGLGGSLSHTLQY